MRVVPDWRMQLTDTIMLDRHGVRDLAEPWSASSEHGMVSAAHYRATRAGVEILAAGGNAVDAAIATSLALAVVESAGSGIGGMAMMTVSLADRGCFVLPGPCLAPRNATPAALANSPRYSGYRAVATPAYIAVIDAALSRYGTLPLREVIAPAIELAREGFPLTAMQVELIEHYREGLAKSTAGRFFLDADGRAPDRGSRFVQPELAGTLEHLARAGLRDFYEGDIAHRIARDMAEHDGFIDAEDLAAVVPPAEQAPVRTVFRNAGVASAGPPAGGETLAQMLNLFAALAHPGFDADTPDGVELLAAVIARARTDRRRYRFQRPEDPDLASPDYASQIAPQVAQQLGVGETSHLSVMDCHGNAVALTQSIERSFGAKVVTPGLGFLHNGYMKGFKVQAKRHPHYLRPGAVARSNAAPTIVHDADGPILAIGSTGSERMLSGIFGVMVRLGRQSPFDAVHAPRLHVTPEGVALVEADRMPPGCLQRLEDRGYTLDRTDAYAFKFGGLHLVVREGARLTGVAEPRRDGAAAGPDDPPGRPTK